MAGLWRWRRNPLRRRSDLLEGWLCLVAALLIVVAGPGVAALTATSVAHETLRQGEELHRATAVLTAPAPETPGPAGGEGFPLGAGEDRVAADARWTAPNGTTYTGTAPAEPGSEAGTRVTVWLDDEGERRQAPPSPSEAWAGGVMTGAAVGVLVGLLVLGGLIVLRCRLDAWRERRWGREWAEVGPEWSARLRGGR
ncbi:Rv1733c family protein [Streptomyces sp. 6N223]|uniref:Rv1733c family protein n=1 Tax=Streptomyces sp. 6N223 TaxID=3457412 RepID=UPI003FD466A8